MRAYVITTGAVFGLVTVAHALRIVAEGPQLLTQPWWVLVTLTAAGLCVWALRLLKASARW